MLRTAQEEAGAVATATENAIGNPTTAKSLTVPITADVKVGPDAPIALDQEEIQRRRNLVRMLFNDFWSGAHDKPVAFSGSGLMQAEDYVKRLRECSSDATCRSYSPNWDFSSVSSERIRARSGGIVHATSRTPIADRKASAHPSELTSNPR